MKSDDPIKSLERCDEFAELPYWLISVPAGARGKSEQETVVVVDLETEYYYLGRVLKITAARNNNLEFEIANSDSTYEK